MDAIEFEDVWKRFRVPHQKRRTVLENIAGALSMFQEQVYSYEEFWALRGVSFSVPSGESLGIVGENGSGKSTLLKLIPGILRPTKGKTSARGKIAPILELGAGFHPELTVKENLLVFGAAIGIESTQIKKKTEEMIEFAEVERFADSKLRNLSSGMQVRVAFAVVVQSEADIFLIDEALAVGDIGFQKKCIDRFQEFRKQGRTIILVSHNVSHITTLCDRALYLSKGEVRALGEPESVVSEFVRSFERTLQA